MSLNVGGIYIASTDRDRVVELIREYWLKRGATPMTGDPLEIEPLSLESMGQLGFAVSSPAEGDNDDGREWIAIYDSERYHGDSELAKYLAEALGTSAVIYGMYGASDMADIEGFGPPLPDLPSSGSCENGDDEDDDDDDDEDEEEEDYEDYDCDGDACDYGGDWGEIETFVAEKFPYPFLYYNQLKDVAEEAPDFLEDWAVFGFEKIPYIPDSAYSGPDDETIRFEAEKKEVDDCIERGDLARLEELYAGGERIRYQILSEIAGASCNVSNATVRLLIMAFAERVLAENSDWMVRNVAEAALLEDNDELFERACAQLGDGVARFNVTAFNLLQAKDIERGYKLLRKTVSSPKCSPVDWNNLAYAMIPLVEAHRPPDLVQLMEEASKHGTVNPPLWHNVACVWAKAGYLDRAIEAVACARRDGYDKMDTIATDDDLIALRGDPRFERALKGGDERVALSSLVRVEARNGVPVTMNRPVILFSFVVPFEDGAAFGRGAAALLRRYCADAPEGVLSVYRTEGGPWKPLSEKVVSRHLSALAAIPAESAAGVRVLYRGGGTSEVGEASPYGVDIEYTRFDDGEGWRSINLSFPCEDAAHPETLLRRFLAYAELVPYETARCGFAMQVVRSDYIGTAEANEWDKQLTERFYGFQPSMGWLTLVGREPLERVGGGEKLRTLAPHVLVSNAPNGGLCLRAALYPPMGLNTQPDDIGAMPEAARALASLELGGTLGGEQAGRLNGLANGKRINNPPNL